MGGISVILVLAAKPNGAAVYISSVRGNEHGAVDDAEVPEYRPPCGGPTPKTWP